MRGQRVGFWRKAECELLGEHETIDRSPDASRSGERGAGARESRFVNCEGRMKAVPRGKAERMPDMGFGIQIGAGRLRRRCCCLKGKIDAAGIDDRKLEQAARGQGL